MAAALRQDRYNKIYLVDSFASWLMTTFHNYKINWMMKEGKSVLLCCANIFQRGCFVFVVTERHPAIAHSDPSDPCSDAQRVLLPPPIASSGSF